MSELSSLELFVVRNKEGKFFRRKGYGGVGDTWVEGVATARIYANIRGARTIVAFFANRYPQYGVPEIVKMKVSETEIIDDTERIKKNKEKKLQRQEKQEVREREADFNRAKRELEVAKMRFEEAQKRKK